MSAQIIQLSDHRKVRTPATPRLMDASLTVFVAYLAIGIAINEAIIEATQVRFQALILHTCGVERSAHNH